MPPVTIINNFLDRIVKKCLYIRIINGIYLFCALLTGGFLITNLVAYFAEDPKTYLSPIVFGIFIALGYILIRYLIQPLARGFSRENAAILVESLISGLNNSLINACQLQKKLEEPNAEKIVSLDFINKMLRETRQFIQDIQIDKLDHLLEKQKNFNNRNLFIIFLGMVLFASMILPDFFTLGYEKWITPPPRPEPVLFKTNVMQTKQQPASANLVSISDIRLKFNFPSYTQMSSETVDPSDGTVNVLPGTEIQIKAKSSQFLTHADLVINGKDRFALAVKQGRNLWGSFMAYEKGYYQFGVKSQEIARDLLNPKYPILLKKDHSPQVILFLANPKPIYHESENIQFYYEGHDDFGIQAIDLIVNVEGKTTRKRVKTIRGLEMDVKDGYIWNLNRMILQPGDTVEYYLEIKDNDNVAGPNTGQSEVYSFTIFDSSQELENLIELQDELVNRMIALLSESLMNNQLILSGSFDDPTIIKKAIAITSDRLIEIIHLVQKIQEQAQPVQSLSPSYLTFFKNIMVGLTKIREDQIQLIKKLDHSIGNTIPVGHNFPPIGPLNEKLIEHLERDVLFLIKITNRQKMSRVIDLENQLKNLTDSIKEEFEKIQNKKATPSANELRKRLQKMQNIFEKMIDQLSRQTQRLPDEFLNPNSLNSLKLENLKASLDKIMKLVDQDKIDDAMKELNKIMDNLQALANQLDQSMSNMDQTMDTETIKQIDESLKNLLKIEKRQKELLDQTTKINQEVRQTQVNKFEGPLKEFFKSLIKDVQSAQLLLNKTNQFLKDNPSIKKYNQKLDQEVILKRAIEKLRQQTIDLSVKTNIEEKFLEIRKFRQELTNVLDEKHALQIETYQNFKNNLPELQEKYHGLKELAELFDIREFNSLFKGTYPMTFRWQHKIRMIPKPTPELSDRLQKDLQHLRQINTEISKKLGSMLRQLEEEYDSLISKGDKNKLQEMAQKQSQMRMETQNLEKKLTQMGQKNPMIDPEIASKMSSAGRYMKSAEKNFKKPDVPQTIDSENGALEKMAETRDMLNQLKNPNQENPNSRPRPFPKFGTGPARDQRRGGSVRMQRERVDLPSEEQHQSPAEFRAEIMSAMKGQHPKKYERFIMEYYRELVK